MKKRNVIITGCSSGIGRCVAEGLKEKGYRVFATARKKTDVDILIAEGFESVQLDLANSASIRSAFDTILEKSEGEIYALFNNGAYGQPGAVEDLSRDVLRQQFEVNLFGTHELTNLVLPVMRKQGYGRIIQNSSVLGFVAFIALAGAVLVAAAIIGVRLWWFNRRLGGRRKDHANQNRGTATGKDVIEGEFREVGTENDQDSSG